MFDSISIYTHMGIENNNLFFSQASLIFIAPFLQGSETPCGHHKLELGC